MINYIVFAVLIILLFIADLFTTRKILDDGGIEKNPAWKFMMNQGIYKWVKALICGYIVFAIFYTGYLKVGYFIVLCYLGIFIWNILQIKKQRR